VTWSNFGGVPLLLLGVTLCGFATGSAHPVDAYFSTRYFGIKSLAEIYGSRMAMYSFATGFAPPLTVKLFDRTGSYNVFILVIATGYVRSAILTLTLGLYCYALHLREPEPAPAVGRVGPRLGLDFGAVPDKRGGLNGSTQHQLKVYFAKFKRLDPLAGIGSKKTPS